MMMFDNKEKILLSTSEISLYDLVHELLLILHNNFNTKRIKSSKKPGSNNINDEDNDNNIFDFTNEEKVISFAIKDFTEKFRSKISDLFYYIRKSIHDCSKCQIVTGYSSDICFSCTLNPDLASIYLEKIDLKIIDLFKFYKIKILYCDIYEECPKCGTIIKDIKKSNIFYTSLPNLILYILYKEKDIFNLTLDESINIKDFIERTDVSKVDYRLVGAIFTEDFEDEKKYISITRNIQLNDGSWIYYNGNSIKRCSFKELVNHKNLKMLFYTTE